MTPAFFFEIFILLGQIRGKTVPNFLGDCSGAALGEGRTFKFPVSQLRKEM